MRKVIIRRLLGAIPVLISMTLLTFFISHIIPSDPARLMAGPKASAEVVESYREKYGLSLPLWQQYLRYMSGVVRFDFGESFATNPGMGRNDQLGLPIHARSLVVHHLSWPGDLPGHAFLQFDRGCPA